MKIQGLAVIAIVIILPMAIILNTYSASQIKTLDLQVSYDSKLQSATYDAIKAFQMNMSNSTTSDLANSKMRDIQASITTFYNSLSSHFDMAGYGEDVLKDYVPAIVYTLYDGYYIYSAYDNTLDLKSDSTNPSGDEFYPQASYQNGETIYGLKPYIYYSCRYKRGSDDFTITYSLDSYITIQGTINNKAVNASGYLLTGVDKNAAGNYTYRGVEIVEENDNEGLQQNVYLDKDNVGNGNKIFFDNDTNKYVGRIAKYPYKKINGVKYYKETETGKVFTLMNDEKLYQENVSADDITKNNNGIKYYEDAYNFKQYVLGTLNLGDLSTAYAVDSNGVSYNNRSVYSEEDDPYPIDRKIFDELNNLGSTTKPYIEDENSDFNTHKTEVIKNSIESNLIVAISNYNNVSTSSVNFEMPKLQDYEWENITHNISMITFLQGLSIGGKVYNGYSIVQNNINDDYVSENSIYILNNGTYYGVTSTELMDNSTNLDNAIGLINTDFERRTVLGYYKDGENELKKNIYYYPREDDASYNSIINPNGANNQSISEYLKNAEASGSGSQIYRIAQIYYTALGRERYSMYRVMNKLEDVQEDLIGNIPNIQYGKGDINGDGTINLNDLMMLLNHISGKNTLSGNELNKADINGDGLVDMTDLTILQKYVSKSE